VPCVVPFPKIKNAPLKRKGHSFLLRRNNYFVAGTTTVVSVTTTVSAGAAVVVSTGTATVVSAAAVESAAEADSSDFAPQEAKVKTVATDNKANNFLIVLNFISLN
jgi:hypothetical protein